MVRTLLDGTDVTNPNGLNTVEQNIEYNPEYRGIFNYINADLEFSGDGYNYLEDKVLSTPCGLVDFELYVKNKPQFKGTIDVTDASGYNVTRRIVKLGVQDDNLSAYITKNSKIKTFINLTLSKNGETITPATELTSVDFFTPSTGNYDFNIDDVYPVGDALRFLVDFMSDANMTFSSPLFDSGGDLYGICVMNGKKVSSSGTPNIAPEISFYDIYTELNKLFNIGMYVDFSGIKPELVIDYYDNIFVDTEILSISDVKDLTMTVDKDMFYSKVILGSKKVQTGSDLFTVPDVRFLAFEEEEYLISGQCNFDNDLNLVNNYIIDSNIIEDCILNNNNTYEDDTFLIEIDISANQAVRYANIAYNSGYMYNQGLNNFNKSQYWLNSIPSDIVAYLTTISNNFEATDNSVILSTGTIILPTEVADPGNHYDPVTGRYTCGVGLEGVYTFNIDYSVSFSGDLTGTLMSYIDLVHYDSGGVEIGRIRLKNFISDITVIGSSTASAGFYLYDGDYVELEATVVTGTTSFGILSFYGNFAEEGGTYATYDINNVRAFKITFDAPLTYDEYISIKENPTKYITVSSRYRVFKGWVDSLKRNMLTGMSKIVLKASNFDNQKNKIKR